MSIEQPANANVLAHLGRGGVVPPFSWYRDFGGDAYYEAGCHPDIVQRLWDQIGVALPRDCRSLVCGVPALTHPDSGVILAVGMGTQYCLKLDAPLAEAALVVGARSSMRWSDGTTTDLGVVFGAGWVFGGWLSQEPEWCRETFEALG